tara:strand:- start:3939 stop:4616 length:678 start_codon:yes stop_codon:yes gene_type:complete
LTLLIDKFNYSHLKRKTIEGKRHYLDGNGQAVPSVTTILSHGKDMTAINNWKKRVGNAEAQRIVTESANLGTITHKHLECYIEGTERPAGNNLIYKQAKELSDVIIEQGMKEVEQVWAIEQGLCFPGLYAGTADMVCQYKGKGAIGDFKTSRQIKKREWIEDYFVQCAAYALAHNEVYGTDINTGLIFIVSHSGKYQEFVVEQSEFKHYTDIWLNKVEQYYNATK